ncbi:sugar phosphate isomerase/epimerase [Pelagibacteraceae bacterium]|nr:sugar phosphate isomerase/epimerase [Pelagibacteraceae bacterium]
MNICATNISYKNLKFENFLDITTSIGYKNIEVAPFLIYRNPFENKNKYRLKKIIKRKKIIIESFQSIFYNIKNSNDKVKIYENTLERFTKIVDLANDLEVKKISIGNCPSRKLILEKNQLIDYNLKIFDQFSKKANKHGIKISIEPVKSEYLNNFLFSTEEVVFFIKKLKQKNVMLLLDTGNLNENLKNIKNYYQKNYKIINHIHISNSNIKKLSYIKSKNIINFLKDSQYNKSLTLEFISNNGNYLIEQKNILRKFI